MLAKGYEREFAERCFGQIEAREYGFPESMLPACDPRLCLGLVEMPLSRPFRRRAAQRQPMGFLFAGANRA